MKTILRFLLIVAYLYLNLLASNTLPKNPIDPFNHIDSLKKEVEFTKEERGFLDNHPIIKVYMDYAYPPYSIVSNGQIEGFSIEYADLLSKLLGIRFKYTTDMAWSDAVEALKTKEIDMIGQMVNTQERREFTLFTHDYYNYYTGVATQKKNTQYTSLKSLENRTVGLVKGYYEEALLKKHYPKIKIKTYKDNNDLLKALLNDEFDATIQTYQVLEYLISTKKLKDQLINIPLKVEPILGITREAFGIRKDWELLSSAMDKVITLTGVDRDNIERKWLSGGVKKDYSLVLNDQEKRYLQSKDFITMCIDPDWEPYEKIDKDGKHTGMAADFINLISKKLNKDIKLVPTKTWDESLEYIKKGECEILSFLNKTTQREKYLNFTTTLYEESDVIITNDTVTYLDGLKSLEGKSVGIVKGYRTDEYISKYYPNIDLKYIQNHLEGINLVSKGKLDATINPLLGTTYLIKKLGLSNVKIAGKTELKNQYKIGVIKSDEILYSILSKAVTSISEKEKSHIVSNWKAVRFQKSIDYSIIWQVTLFFLIIILFLYYRHYTIKKINKKLKNKMKLQLEQIIEKDHMLFEQNKLAAMGEMIENIAHQWRQPLSQINASIMTIDDILYDYNIKSKKLQDELLYIEEITKYMSSTIDDFKNFFSKSDDIIVFDLDKVLDETLSIIKKSLFSSKIKLNVNSQKNTFIKGNKGDLSQALLVIINNAKDILILRDIKDPKIDIELYEKGDDIYLQICDNAGGVPNHIGNRIFEPYFTTKHKNQGTGLGLYIAKMIIEVKMKGSLVFENKNDGACFTITLKREKNR